MRDSIREIETRDIKQRLELLVQGINGIADVLEQASLGKRIRLPFELSGE